SGRPAGTAVEADFGEDIEKAIDQVPAGDGPDRGLAFGLEGRAFAEVDWTADKVKLKHFCVEMAAGAVIGRMSDVDAAIGGAGAGMEGRAVVEGDFEVQFRAEGFELAASQRRQRIVLGEEPMPDIPDDDPVVIEDVPECGADINRAGRRQ